MRSFVAGLLLLALSTAAQAQVTGQVLGVGFGNHYRPDCWTPMLVQLTSQQADPATYQIQVVQEDLDRDRVVYTQQVDLGGNADGKNKGENFWIYFRPKPTERGLPDAADLSSNLNDLNKQLKVFLCDRSGKQLQQLPITTTIFSVDRPRSEGDTSRSHKFVIFVTDGADKARLPDYSTLKGVTEDVDAVVIHPTDLPESILGYEGLDAIVWLDADASFLTQGTHTRALQAIDQYIREGGRLVVCEPAEPFKIRPFSDMLPVLPAGQGEWTLKMEDRKDADALREFVHMRDWASAGAEPWPDTPGPFKVARAYPAPGAVVDQWIEWPNPGGKPADRTPYIARQAVDLGSVTWVAQNLASASLTSGAIHNWAYVWDHVLGWNVNHDSIIPALERKESTQTIDDRYGPASAVDLGYSLLNGMELGSKSAYLIGLASFFFIVYWVVAGPGVYLVLLGKKKAHLSWFFFGAAALLATLVTVALVKLVLRGPPELRHISFVRAASGSGNAIVYSRFGLYIPRDGNQQIELKDVAAGSVSYLAPFAINPQYVKNDDTFPAYLEYRVPVPDATSTGPPSITVPYRSTLKKLEAKWIGQDQQRVEPDRDKPPRMVRPDKGYLQGWIVNRTGRKLSNVYIAFQHPGWGDPGDTSPTFDDYLVYIPSWDKDAPLDLGTLMTDKTRIRNNYDPSASHVIYGPVAGQEGVSWQGYWYGSIAKQLDNMSMTFPMLTLFDRLPASERRTYSDTQRDRFELYRRGGRALDLSQSIDAGRLVVIGESDEAIPIPLQVEGSPVAGSGVSLYQFVLPLDRTAIFPPLPEVKR